MKTTKNTTWKQKLESDRSLKHTIKRIFEAANDKFKTHKEILDELENLIYNEQKYQTLPVYVKYGIRCYADAFFDMQYSYLEWVHWYDGKFVGSKLPYGEGFNQKLVESDYVYKGTQNKY